MKNLLINILFVTNSFHYKGEANMSKVDYEFLNERKKQRQLLKENAVKLEKERLNAEHNRIEDIRMNREAKLEAFQNFKSNVKVALLSEALGNICVGSIYHPSNLEKSYCEALIGQYIQENGAFNIIRKMKRSDSALLRNIAEEVEEYSEEIVKDANPDDEDSQVIDKEKVADFWKEIDKANDIEDVTNTIRLRVANAEEDFLDKARADKNDIDDILQTAADNVAAAKEAGDKEDDYAEKVEESETRIARDKIYQIQHEGKRNLFDRMVRNLSEIAMKNEDIKDTFIENGKLNVNKIVDSVRCMYTMLEMVSTLQIEKVDAAYIENTLASMK